MLWGLYSFYIAQAELQTARELGEQSLSLAQSVQDPVLLMGAHYMLGLIALFFPGEDIAARAHFEQIIALYDPQQHSSYALLLGQDLGVSCFSYGAQALWLLGYPDQALKSSHEALTLVRELSHPLSLALALYVAASIHQFRREGQAAQERAETAIALSSEQGFPVWLAWATIMRGWALAEQGQGEEGVAQMRQGLAAWRAIGAEVARPFGLALLVEAYGKVGQAAEGLSVRAEALAVVDKNGERMYEAELYRLKGTLTLQSKVPSQEQSGVRSPESEAEEYFLKALEIARRQSAKSLELRAVMSLARLWQQQGKRDEARQMLAEIYGWFTEGFDTADLKEAKALLESLESSV